MADKVELIRFKGIDNWNRPIFKSLKYRNYFGSTDKLFGYSATEEEVLEQITEKDLTFFGNSFGCEPMGTPVEGTIKIVTQEEAKSLK